MIIIIITDKTVNQDKVHKIEDEYKEKIVKTSFEEFNNKLTELNPKKVVVDVEHLTKDKLKKIKETIDVYNEKVWKYHLDQIFSKDFVAKEGCFYAAFNYVTKDTPFCPGFNVHKGDTYDDIFNNHICKLLQ